MRGNRKAAFELASRQSVRGIALAGTLILSACASGPGALAPQPLVPAFEAAQVEGDPISTHYSDYSAATLAASEADYGRAAGYFARAINTAPASAHIAERAFFGLVYAGRIEEAMKVAVSMTDEAPDAVDDLARLIYVLEAFVRQDWNAVTDRIGMVKGQGFGFIVSPIFDAWAHAQLGDLNAAENALAPLLASDSLKSIGQEFWAYILEGTGNIAQAEQLYRDLVNSPQLASLQPVIALADLLVRTNRAEDAKEFLGEQLQRYASNGFLRREAYRILYSTGPSHRPRDPLGSAALIFFRLGNELGQGSSRQGAVIYLQVARFLAPHVSDTHLMLGTMLEGLGQDLEAADAFGAILPTDPTFSLARIRRVEAMRRAGNTEEAAALIEEALMQAPDNRALKTTLADIRRGEGRFEEAIAGYSDAIRSISNPAAGDWWLYFARAISYEQTGDWPSAQRDLLTALKLNPEQPDLLNFLGYSWVDRGLNIEEAKGMIEKAVAARPEDGMVLDSLGWVHFLTGAYDQAVAELEKAVKLEPTDPVINGHLGDAYWAVGRKIEARFQWKHALELGPEDDDARLALENKVAFGLDLADVKSNDNATAEARR